MAIKVHNSRFIRKMTFDMKDVHVTCSNSDTSTALTMIRYSLPMAIKVHTGRFIRKMTFDMKDVQVTCSNSDTSKALTMIRYSLPLATRFLQIQVQHLQ